MSAEGRSPEEKARSKRAHASSMMLLGAIMTFCALASAMIAMRPGVFPAWMMGRWMGRRDDAAPRRAPMAVRFFTFDQATLARAGRERRFILLHLSATWSGQGRLMEETVYADEGVARWILANVIAARADGEERPDLSAKYFIGSWPATVLLSPDGRAVAVASRLTPGLFLPWARLIVETLRESPSKTDAVARDVGLRLAAARAQAGAARLLDDPVWGGVYRGEGEYAKVLA
ncbi:MAG: DUF255 domain-containing protein, partial [Elusimicrobiota bacterium]